MYVEKFNSKNRNDIYKLWYDIYYIEMNRNHKYVCHNKKTIIDELEDSSTILVLKNSNKQIIGTSRINTPYDNLYEYFDFYKLNHFEKNKVAIVTKFMIEREYRKNQTSYILALSTVEYCKQNNIEWIIMDCSPRLYDFFEKLGFKEYLGIKYSEHRAWDLIVYPGHVAILTGDGGIVHASNSKPYPQGGIKYSSNALYRPYIAVRRIVE